MYVFKKKHQRFQVLYGMICSMYKALRVVGVSACYARSQGIIHWNDRCSRWSNMLGTNRRPANDKSSMLQENKNRDGACTYVRTKYLR